MKKDTIMAWGSFIGHFAWYHIIFYNFTNSPLSILAARVENANPQTLLTLFLISTVMALLVSFWIVKDKDMHTSKPFWLSTHIAMFVCAAVIPLITGLSFLYLLVILCGGCSGVIFFRMLYSSFFHAPKIGWFRMLIIALVVFNTFTHLYALVPDEINPALMYAVSLIVLCADLIMSLSYNGNTLEIRKSLPENKLTLKSILPVVALLTGVATCFAAYRSVVLTVMPETFDIAVHQAVVCAISLVGLFAFGNKLTQDAYLKIFLALLTATFISFQLLGTGGHKVAETFMQPAYICWNILLLSYLRSLFHQYGKNHLRLRIVMVIFFVSIVMPETIARWFFKEFLAGRLQRFELLYIIVFGLVLLIPQIGRTLTAYEKYAVNDYLCSDFIPLPSAVQSQTVDDAYTKLLVLLSPTEHLTAKETDVLKLILERQDIDIMAYMLNISLSTVRTHIKHICEKFAINSKAELINMAGIADAMGRFSAREKEVLRLAAFGHSDAQIATDLFISTNTVRSHIHNLYKKCGVSSRKDLIRAYTEAYNERRSPNIQEQIDMPH